MPLPQPDTQPKFLIVGAGIGGLATALALHARGFINIHIFEIASTLTTMGVGINVLPSAVVILRNLGLLKALEKTGITTQEVNMYNRHGDFVFSEPRGLYAEYLVPQFSLHREEFQMLLLSAVKERLGECTLHLNHALTGFDQNDESITARFSQRKDGAPAELSSVTGDVLIAADGINFAAHALLYPNEGPPRFSGNMFWRGCIERDTYLTGASMLWAGHADQKFIAYPLSQRSADKDKSDVDLTPSKTDWTKALKKEVFAEPFATWRCGGLEMADLIGKTEKVYEFPISDRDPVSRWSFGRLTLIGDAAHTMYPIGSNGASQAIIDAETLATYLSHSGFSIQQALKAYGTIRLPLTTKIVMAHRAQGLDYVLQLAEERALEGFDNVYDVISKEELEKISLMYKVVAGYEATDVSGAARAMMGTD